MMPDNPKCPVCGKETAVLNNLVYCSVCAYSMQRETFARFFEAFRLASLLPKPEEGFEIVSGGGATGKGWKWYSVKCKQWLYCAEGEMVNELLLARPIAKEPVYGVDWHGWAYRVLHGEYAYRFAETPLRGITGARRFRMVDNKPVWLEDDNA